MASSFEKSVKGATKIKVRHRLLGPRYDTIRLRPALGFDEPWMQATYR